MRAMAMMIGALAVSAGMASGQTTVSVDCSGASISAFAAPADITRTSTGTIQAANGYTFAFDPIVTGTGLLGGFIGTDQPLGTVLNGFLTGGQRVLFGAVRNPAGTLPTLLDTEVVGGSFSGIDVSLTLRQELLADGRARAAITEITRPFGLGLRVESGGLVVNTWTPPPAVKTEWQFEGDLQSVKQSGLAPASGPARLRYLDDPAFAPFLGGEGNLENYPVTPTPSGITQAQSAFGTTAAFGIPPIAGVVDTVYRTSPPRNANDGTNSDKRRTVGLALWPNTRDFWPEDRNGQWTMVWDLLIPASSWEAARTVADGISQCIPLIESSANNNSAADVFLRVVGNVPASASIGQGVSYTNAVQVLQIQPDQWFRLAIVTDHYGKFQSRIFVNGVFVGTSGTDWLYNACKASDPRWGDPSATNPQGTPVPPPSWSAWGQFPNPWAQLPTTAPNTLPAYMQSTFTVFADLMGRGESVYVANMLFTDEAMSDAQVLALGSPNARGIVHLRPNAPTCPADFDSSGGVSIDDLFLFLNAWFSGCVGQAGAPCNGRSADVNGINGVSIDDLFLYLNLYFVGC